VDLTGRVALITGGKRIGAVVATHLAAQGADVALVYHRSAAEADATAAAIRATGRRAHTLQADLSDAAACRRAVEETVAALGRLDVLVNMASLYVRVALDGLDVDTWDRQMAVDLRGTFACSHAAIPHMRRQGGGRIVNFTDWVVASGRPRYPGYAHYYAAKAGVKALTEAMALELAADQILVNAVAPGPIVAPPGTTPEEHEAVVKATPLGRWGGEAEIAKAVRFLVETDFVTGETIRVDGGRHVR
jgi:NAD(P)-dependent dehydrogenase (short-subunit alcohol dehydrogenase family)